MSGPEHMSDPEMSRVRSAFAEAHNPALAAPLARERAEAERLADILRERYSTPGAVQFVGDGARMEEGFAWNLLGGWRKPVGARWPRDVRAVDELLSTLKATEQAADLGAALFHGKRIIALLRAAQEECDEVPEPLELSQLTNDTQRTTLCALAQLPEWAGMRDLFMKTGNSDKSTRNALRALKKFGLVERAGRGGSTTYRLTPEGYKCAEWLVLHQ